MNMEKLGNLCPSIVNRRIKRVFEQTRNFTVFVTHRKKHRQEHTSLLSI